MRVQSDSVAETVTNIHIRSTAQRGKTPLPLLFRHLPPPRVDYQLVAIFFRSFVALQLARMKRLKILLRLLLAVTLLFQSVLSIQAQNTGGTEFWVTFGQDRNQAISTCEFQIRIIAGNKATTGTIYFTNLNEPVPFSINAYGVYNYDFTTPQKTAACNTATGITNYSIRITSEEQVTVYAYQASNFIHREATNVLPVSALGMAYYQISYTPIYGEPDAYAVVATQNNTQVNQPGTPVVTLNAGQVYYYTSTDDLTGIYISTNKPVAFFSLHKGTSVPFGTSSPVHLFQQLAPVNTWGKSFFVPVTKTESEIVRIVASRNGTNITQLDGGSIRNGVSGAQTSLNNLQAGDFVELDIFSNGCFIVADNPVGVCTYMKMNEIYDFFSIPSHCWVPAIEQTVSSALLAPFLSTNHNCLSHFALVITPTATRDNTKVSIGGAAPEALTGDIWKNSTAAGMSFYSYELTNTTASYIISNPEGIIIFGYGVGVNSPGYYLCPTSYYYLAYSAMRDLEATFSVNDIPYQLLKENDFCEGDVHFLADIEGLHPTHPDRITWWIDGVEYLPAKTLEEWWKPFTAGTYEIRMDVIYDNYETASKTGTLVIKSCNQHCCFSCYFHTQ